MKKNVIVTMVAFLLMVVIVTDLIAEEVFKPAVNNSGTIGAEGRAWRKGFFQKINIAGADVTATSDMTTNAGTQTLTNKTLTSPTVTTPTITTPVITNPSIQWSIASHDYGGATTDWTLSSTEKIAGIIFATGASGAANIIGPAENRIYYVINKSGGVITFKKSGATGCTIADGSAGVVGYNSYTGYKDYKLLAATISY